MRQLPKIILQQLAREAVLRVVSFGVRGVAKPMVVQIASDRNEIDIIPRRTRVEMNIQWERLEGIFDKCDSICVGLEGGKKVYTAQGTYEGYETTIRIHCLPGKR